MARLGLLWALAAVAACLLSQGLRQASVSAASAHIHSHEREADGAMLPDEHNRIHREHQSHSEFDHEAILGSVKEAEEFDHLSPDESKRRLGILLSKMDVNGDKNIDRSELHAWIMRSFKMLSEEEAGDRFEDADEDSNGFVTWLEYAKNSFGEDTDFSDDHLEGAHEKLMKNEKVMFEAADSNKDGKLDRAEFLIFQFPEENPAMHPHLLAQTLEEKDKDSDGFINFEEFLDRKEGESPEKEYIIVQEQKFNGEFDKDGDGRLNSAEILSWITPNNDDIAKDEVDHLFASADDDHDDLLSYNEILEHYDVFVGSEATDYGDHLHNMHLFDEL
ncbi:hypothetical protein ONE63_004318 [Megalurothrips usitatus]|uniref:Reticulocalbin-3 n=1 Tax=Megalurothrips usitatus TaxID=439358 RepID=A0AAV7X6H4_9NEOP|nr:hypothetical protein ONE63_004318 [Megalurothrips usitatus]